MIIKVRRTKTPGHDHLMFWMGRQEGHLANIGQLVTRPDEADKLIDTLTWGSTGTAITVIVDTDG